MIIRNFYNDKLAQASYLVGCQATGEAIVIDPLRDVQPYLQMAESQGLRIVAVTETHIHADYLSGTRQLAAQTGATMYLSDEGGPDWTYAFGQDPNVVLMKDGHVIRFGNLTLKAIHTPGHTPEHLSFLLTDHPAGEQPHSFFTGDFLFASDVGRPDLLERAANIANTMEKGARILFQSIQKTASLPDSLLVWPAHGSGSACGKALGGSPVTSLGYERATNWAFQIKDEGKFVDEVLAGQPEPPHYFAMMKRLNKQGPAVLPAMPNPPHLETTIGQAIDVRSGASIRGGFEPGAIAIPSGKGLTNWSGWLLDYEKPYTLIADSEEQAVQAALDMASIGLDHIQGWRLPQGDLTPIEDVTCSQIQEGDFVLDVRGANEFAEVHMAKAAHIPLGYLSGRLEELPRDRRIVVHCASGGRSPIAVSILRKAGFEQVAEISGGIQQVQQRCPVLLGAA